MLASLSTTYYTFLEQGRPVRPSAQVLDALAAALRMSAAERRYLEVLAHGPDGAGVAVPDEAPPEVLAPAVADLVQRLDPCPALVKGRRWDVLAANQAARELFTDWMALPRGQRNLVRWMFLSSRAREVYLEWEAEARAMLGRFRLAAARLSGRSRFPGPDRRAAPGQRGGPGLVAPARRGRGGQRVEKAVPSTARAGGLHTRRAPGRRPARADPGQLRAGPARPARGSGTELPEQPAVGLIRLAPGRTGGAGARWPPPRRGCSRRAWPGCWTRARWPSWAR